MALCLSVLWLSAFCRPDKTRERRHPADSPRTLPDGAALISPVAERFGRPDKTRERRHPADSPQKVPDLAA
ncbi:hypothetical protein [Citrobacter sp. CK180]|uniref:hypothetical protein n=1 Tax=Citrobacter sp. CK180 TaxID=2985089 RepID=UPI002574D507|nr:hypothetical protein [Citrobacter sp. CK180]MDM3064534.1 hypothetical protein [Citrobacter sp. CK180]